MNEIRQSFTLVQVYSHLKWRSDEAFYERITFRSNQFVDHEHVICNDSQVAGRQAILVHLVGQSVVLHKQSYGWAVPSQDCSMQGSESLIITQVDEASTLQQHSDALGAALVRSFVQQRSLPLQKHVHVHTLLLKHGTHTLALLITDVLQHFIVHLLLFLSHSTF